MNGRSGIFKFFLLLFVAVILLLEYLSLIQGKRLNERLDEIVKRISSGELSGVIHHTVTEEQQPTAEHYIGDEGDWLVRCLSAEPATLNDIVEGASWATRWIVSGNIFESMIEYKPDAFEYRGRLAEAWSISKDGLEIYFKLRDDICFSDGEPVTTDDVIFTFKTITDPNVDAAAYANYFADVDHYEKLNDREIKFYMKKVYFLSLGFLGGMPIHPKHIYQYIKASQFNNRRTDPVGTGPYVFEKWDVGNQVVLGRNENYWGEKPKIRKLVFRFITNDTAALQSLLAGEVDYLRPLPEQFSEKENDEQFRKDFYCLSYWDASNTGYFWIGWNEARPFFADRRVRLALTELIDRQAIKEHILRNPEAEIPTGPFYINGPQSDPNIKPWPYDPENAKKLLDEAGWIDSDGDGIRDKGGVPFRFRYMIVSGAQLHEQMAKLVKDSLSKAGIDVIIDPYEWSVFTQRVQDRDFDALNMAWGGNVESDPYQIWHSSQIKKGSNYVRFSNAEADRLIEQARQTLDADKRNALYHRFHRIIHEEQPYTFIYTRPEQRFLDRRFQNVIIHKLGIDEHEWYVPKDKQKYK
jgi:peptide/nickel transport system substrate-binding protein